MRRDVAGGGSLYHAAGSGSRGRDEDLDEGDELETDGMRSEAQLIATWAAGVLALLQMHPVDMVAAAQALAEHMDATAKELERQASEIDREELRKVRRR